MTEKERQAQIHGLAALVGQTTSQLKALDENIVSTSTNLQTSQQSWTPEAHLQRGIQDIMAGAPAQAPEPMPLPSQPELVLSLIHI